MKLRRWQKEAVSAALTKFKYKQTHFLCLATPGAGKTVMASTVAKRLLNSSKIDLVFCFTPSVIVASSFKATLEAILASRFDGQLGSLGNVLTYQSMLNLDQSFWSLFDSLRVLVIFDEIHHCAGDHLRNANAWGQKVLQKIQGRATYTLALSGTPWRSDSIPIVLSSYCREGKIHCDYKYGIGQAIEDGVCRIPKITAIDNGSIIVKSADKEDYYQSFRDLLQSSNCTYQQLLENKTLINYFVELSLQRLHDIRKSSPDAGGLVVAASVAHAHKIARHFNNLGENPVVVSYMQDNPQETIQQFRYSESKWIISVGMISEGTDIPRLRVCCYLSRIKTELYFRQVLGRILRVQQQSQEVAHLLMPAEPDLIEYAKRVSEDTPMHGTARVTDINQVIETMEIQHNTDNEILKNITESVGLTKIEDIDLYVSSEAGIKELSKTVHHDNSISGLSESYEATVDLFGQFKKRIINMSLMKF